MAAPFGRRAAGWPQRGVVSYKKEPQITPPWLDGHKATTKLPIECESVFHFYVVFHDKLLKPAAERLNAAAIMRHHVKIITDRETSHLAHNNDNFCPPCPFKTSSVCASWCLCWWTWGMWWKICHMHRSPEKPPIRRTNIRRDARRESRNVCLANLMGVHHHCVVLTYRCLSSAGCCSEHFN